VFWIIITIYGIIINIKRKKKEKEQWKFYY
jgi:hypothetical protein